MVVDIDEVLRKRGQGYQVICYDDALREFLCAGGDYHFLVHDPYALDESSGGNIVDWSVNGDVVALSSSLVNWTPCLIKKKVLLQAITLLGESRPRRRRA